ncbi:alpha-L-fucosidase [Pontiella sulfatireligans]|uniref:alpha-L-fucosidase n=1 Tax=Pontiella sulfatireligans TaxID=2750658 RepID=A0A6C2UF33_9BACT|nr:alpha-L-fucosidase [Pontiella sulfatireligans]VGO18529.1 hypothetical protein SCARR_00582 [Pontiella sulfatireligans]
MNVRTPLMCVALTFAWTAAQGGSFTDPRDGQTYQTIQVGEHTWMAENLNFELGGSWPWGRKAANGEKYGRMYKPEIVAKAAPSGWHIATNEEWASLVEAMGGADVAGKALKSKTGWQNDGNGVDQVGFNALPGGVQFVGTSRAPGERSSWWSVGHRKGQAELRWSMGCEDPFVYRHEQWAVGSAYVRCVKDYPETKPKFAGTIESLKQYECPEWFRDAKFGIYLHWGIYSVPQMDAWYPRYMYMEGTDAYNHHLKTYGHPSEFGYKDLIPLWKAENFDPDALVSLFKEAGAKYFTPCAVHHDNFDLWDSTYNPWNATKMGPKKDLIGLWKAAADKAGLRWGVTTHLQRSYNWFNTANGADVAGPKKGVPYDALRGEGKGLYPPNNGQGTLFNPPEETSRAWRENWFKRLQQLIDDYEPDHLYFDGAIPFMGPENSQTGLDLMAYYYNTRAEGFLCYKKRKSGLFVEGLGSLDHERGRADGIEEDAWQTDDSIGPWGYVKDATYKTPDQVVDKIIDIVSKNGNMLLNVPIRADGTLDDQTVSLLKNVGRWFKVNGEAIYGTRPWHMYGEGEITAETGSKSSAKPVIRFTTKGETLYAFVLQSPEANQAVVIQNLGIGQSKVGEIVGVDLLGSVKPLDWNQTVDGLHVTFPKGSSGDYAHTLKVRFK